MTETLLAFLVLFLSPLCVMLIGGDNVTSSSSTSPSIPPSSVPAAASVGISSVPLSPSSLSVSSSVSPLALALATAAEPALLAHVYDSNVNFRHRHHPNHPWGPHFEDNVTNVTVREFQNVHLDCRVGLIEDKLVSWVRRKSDQLDLLTLGLKNHSSDPRFFSDFKYPNNWRLGIRNVSRSDSAKYICQISTHPPKMLNVELVVESPEVFVISSRGERVQDVYYKEGSTLQLICEVNNMKSRQVNWYHYSPLTGRDELLNVDLTRGGIRITTDATRGEYTKSILNIARITRRDIGRYLCSAGENSSVQVHILSGENPAELYHNEGSRLLGLSQQLFGCFHRCHHYYQYQQFLFVAIISILLVAYLSSSLSSVSSSYFYYYPLSTVVTWAMLGFISSKGKTVLNNIFLLEE